MKINIISLFPELIEHYFSMGVLSRGLKKKLFCLEVLNPRDFTEDLHRTVDDTPYGGHDGMILLAEPLKKALLSLPKEKRGKVVHLSAQGEKWSHRKCQKWAEKEAFTFICSRYGGVDQRFLEKYVDEEVSVGDFIVSGGELPCLLVIDSFLRWIPGMLGHQDSAKKESFSQESGLLECPQWTRPASWEGLAVPSLCLSGHHQKIKDFQYAVCVLRTHLRRPELLSKEQEKRLKPLALELKKFPPEELASCGLSIKDLESF